MQQFAGRRIIDANSHWNGGGNPIQRRGVLRPLPAAVAATSADSAATGPSPGEASRECEPGLGCRGSAAIKRSYAATASGHAWREACQFACAAARAARTRRLSCRAWPTPRAAGGSRTTSGSDCGSRHWNGAGLAISWRPGRDRSRRSAPRTRGRLRRVLSRQQLLAVWRERECCHTPQPDAARIQLHQFAPRRNIPQADRLITAARRQRAAVGRKRDGLDGVRVSLE